jgi:hypothetical protein
MSEATPRLGLPFIVPGQAQKEVHHNEALARIDVALAPSVESMLLHPPQEPQVGDCWIVAPSPDGDWTGRDHAIACWTAGGWRFVSPLPGMLVWNKDDKLWIHWSGDAWSSGELYAARVLIEGKQVVGPRLPAVPSPSGGTTIDLECRAAVAALIATFKSHGLIE